MPRHLLTPEGHHLPRTFRGYHEPPFAGDITCISSYESLTLEFHSDLRAMSVLVAAPSGEYDFNLSEGTSRRFFANCGHHDTANLGSPRTPTFLSNAARET